MQRKATIRLKARDSQFQTTQLSNSVLMCYLDQLKFFFLSGFQLHSQFKYYAKGMINIVICSLL
jgi:hypothetical protein